MSHQDKIHTLPLALFVIVFVWLLFVTAQLLSFTPTPYHPQPIKQIYIDTTTHTNGGFIYRKNQQK
jgi:hypothetical protein